jgi:RNA polymerase sigma factor (sigma-70 family)
MNRRVSHALSALADWRARAREEAAQHPQHQAKRAVQATEMTEAERTAAGALFEAASEDIRTICRVAYGKARGQVRGLSVEDVYQEAYVLFLRALVHYDPEKASLKTYLYHALRSRVTEYLRTRSAAAPPETLPAQPSRPEAREVDVHAITGRLVEEGRLAGSEREQDELEQAWARLTAPLDD